MRKGFAPIIVVLVVVAGIITVSTITYFLIKPKPYSSKVLPTSNTSIYPKSTSLPATSSVPTSSPAQANVKIENQNGKLIYNDFTNGFQMDVSSIPELNIETGDIYKQACCMNKSGLAYSVARLNGPSLEDNPQELSILDYAKKYLSYKEGTNFGPDGSYVMSSVMNVTLNSGAKGIKWTQTGVNGAQIFSDDYLINIEGKLVFMTMFCWDKSVYDKTEILFQPVISSLIINPSIIKKAT